MQNRHYSAGASFQAAGRNFTRHIHNAKSLVSSFYCSRISQLGRDGECAPLPNLSCDDLPDYEEVLAKICRQVENQGGKLDMEALCKYPSILFGLETAIRHFFEGSWALWDTPFSRGEAGIPINGLIWMGDFNRMLAQIEKKMEAGFRCIKLKIGAINFEEELALLQHIRSHYSSKEIELRVDANGAFSPTDAMEKLKRLSELDLHSIEQPIRAGQWKKWHVLLPNLLCR